MNSHCKNYVLFILLLVTIASAFSISYAVIQVNPNQVTINDGGGGHTHSYKQTKAPTCTAKGTETCSCGATRDISELGHNYEWKSVSSSQHIQICSRCGRETNRSNHMMVSGKCSICGYVKQATVHSHNGSSIVTFIIKQSATCTKEGLRKCAECDYTETIPALGHNFVNGICTRCGTLDSNYTQNSDNKTEHIHDYTYQITKEPTCTDKGQGKCSCGETGEIVALGGKHNWEIVDPLDKKFHIIKCTKCGTEAKEPHDGDPCSQCGFKDEGIPIIIPDNYDELDRLPAVCDHKKTKTEYTCALGNAFHTIKKVCVECGQVTSSMPENHTAKNTKLLEYKQLSDTTHEKVMICLRCGTYVIQEEHSFNDKGVCKDCNYDKEPPVITSIRFKSKSYTKKVGDIVDFSELVEVEPANARYVLVFLCTNSDIIEMYGNGRAEMKQESNGMLVTVIDTVTELTAQTNIKIKKSSGNGGSSGSSDLMGADKITRGQFVDALARFDKAEVKGYANYFNDVDEKADYSESIAWATSNGLVNGVGNGNFAPENYITRQEIAVILYNYIMKFHSYVFDIYESDISDSSLSNSNGKIFNDDAQIASWAKEAVYALSRMGIIQGRSNGSFDPKANLSKGEAGLLLSRIGKLITVGSTSSNQDDSNDKTETTPNIDDTSDHLTGTESSTLPGQNTETTPNVDDKTDHGTSTIPEQNTETMPNVDDTSDHGASTKPEQNMETTPNTSTIDTARYYKPSDFGQNKPIMDKNSYTEEDFLRMEAELKERVDEAGFGTRAGAVAAALYLASLDYAVPYRGTPMDRENYQGTYNKLGMNRQWGRYIALKRDISEKYKKGWVGLNGLDCGAFVTWALVNGGVLAEGQAVSVSPQQYAYDRQPKKISEVFDQIEPGDIMYTYGERNGTKTWTHVALVVGRDSQNVYIAESTTGKLNKVVVTTIPKDTTGGKSWVTLADDKLYKAKNPDGTENKGNVPIVWH